MTMLVLEAESLEAALGDPSESGPFSRESVVAYVVLAESDERAGPEVELRKLCHLHLEGHKVPRRILFVAEIPKTGSGKVKRVLLREHWIDGQR